MGSRSRAYNTTASDWDPMRSDFENSVYDSQTTEDEGSEGVNLDHCRLYITNIPKCLNEKGLQSAFGKYGTLLEAHLSCNPLKRYGLVKYETPVEARLAMVKLNRTEPLKLNISIANKTKTTDTTSSRRPPSFKERERSSREHVEREFSDNGSVTSKGTRVRNENMHPENDKYLKDLEDDEDEDIELSLNRLRQIMYKQKMKNQQAEKKIQGQTSQLGGRCIMSNGKIVVRTDDRSYEGAKFSRDVDNSFGAAGGDSLANIPALQHVQSRRCVSCDRPADLYCAGCGLTPYCGAPCQRLDWARRHSSLCHNLARASRLEQDEVEDLEEIEPKGQPLAPLRRPKSPPKRNFNQRSNEPRRDFDDDNGKGRRFESPQQAANKKRFDSTRGRQMNRTDNSNQNNSGFNGSSNDDNEDWGAKPKVDEKPAPSQQEPKKATPVKAEPKPDIISQTDALKKQTPLPLLSVQSVTPVSKLAKKTLVPEKFLIEKLDVGAAVIVSVECEGKSAAIDEGYVCLSLNEDFQDDYTKLCEEYLTVCDKDTEQIVPTPGSTFSYFNAEDESWYRARSLSSEKAALLDSGKVVPMTPSLKCRKLTEEYAKLPEFSCVLIGDCVKLGQSYRVTIKSKSEDGTYKVGLHDADSGAVVGDAVVSRWMPKVMYPVAAAVENKEQTPVIPSVARPPLVPGGVVLVGVRGGVIAVRGEGARKDYGAIEQDVALAAVSAKPLSEPPAKGQMVLAQYEDGNKYRALVKRTNVKQNKYLIEYIEYGNTEIVPLQSLFTSPPSPPALSSVAVVGPEVLSAPAQLFLQKAVDDEQVFLLTLPNGEKSAPSGSPAILTCVKTKEDLSKTLEEMCKPDWKKKEEKGVDARAQPPIFLSSATYQPLPASGPLRVLDASTLLSGMLSVCDDKDADRRLAEIDELAEKMAEYCESEVGKEPYWPRLEEICIAQCPPFPGWFRAVVYSYAPGERAVQLLYLDYGNVAEAPAHALRRMAPDFMRAPLLACSLEIRGFPKEATEADVAKARLVLGITEEGGGVISVSGCQLAEPGCYVADCQQLIDAMGR